MTSRLNLKSTPGRLAAVAASAVFGLAASPAAAEPTFTFEPDPFAGPQIIVLPSDDGSTSRRPAGTRLIDEEFIEGAGPKWRFGAEDEPVEPATVEPASRLRSLAEHAVTSRMAPAGLASREELLRLQRILDPEGLEIIHSPAAARRQLAAMRQTEVLPPAKPPLAAPVIPEHVTLPEEQRNFGLFAVFCLLETLFMAALLWRRPRGDENS